MTTPPPADPAEVPAVSGQDAWRLLARTAGGSLAVAIVFGVLALAMLTLLGGSGEDSAAEAASTSWRVTSIFAGAQLGGVVAAFVSGSAYLRVLRGAAPQPFLTPVRSRVRRVGTVAAALTALATVVWLAVSPAAWVTTLALGLVAGQGGFALRVLADAHPGFTRRTRR